MPKINGIGSSYPKCRGAYHAAVSSIMAVQQVLNREWLLHAAHWRVFAACTDYAIGVGNRSSEAGVTEG